MIKSLVRGMNHYQFYYMLYLQHAGDLKMAPRYCDTSYIARFCSNEHHPEETE